MYITRKDLEVFGFAAKCPRCMSLLKETEGNGSRVDNKRKADGEHSDDPVRTEGTKWKILLEDKESMLEKTVKYCKTLERTEAKKESEETLGIGVGGSERGANCRTNSRSVGSMPS